MILGLHRLIYFNLKGKIHFFLFLIWNMSYLWDGAEKSLTTQLTFFYCNSFEVSHVHGQRHRQNCYINKTWTFSAHEMIDNLCWCVANKMKTETCLRSLSGYFESFQFQLQSSKWIQNIYHQLNLLDSLKTYRSNRTYRPRYVSHFTLVEPVSFLVQCYNQKNLDGSTKYARTSTPFAVSKTDEVFVKIF